MRQNDEKINLLVSLRTVSGKNVFFAYIQTIGLILQYIHYYAPKTGYIKHSREHDCVLLKKGSALVAKLTSKSD